MTFPLQKPGGWTDDIDTITGQQITNIDVNLSNALDGAAGGVYSPSSLLTIGGSGGLDIQNGASTVMTGPVTLQGPAAHILYRIDRTTIAPSGVPTTFTIDSASDVYISTAPCQAVCDVGVNISTAGFQPAVEGQRIVIQKFPENPVALDVQNIILHQDTPVGPVIGNLVGLTGLVAPQANPVLQIELVFNGTSVQWEVLRMHPQCTL